ncbi:hypothetical protein JCM10207_007970 [Rhodosporidiobolus poonsookiae]
MHLPPHLLLLLAAACTAIAAPLLKRQILDPFKISWNAAGAEPGNIYLSTKSYECGPYSIFVDTRFPPFSVDAIAYPYPDDVANQTVLGSLVADWEETELKWLPNFPEGAEFTLRLTDSQKRTAYSAQKKVRKEQPRRSGTGKTSGL